MPVPVTATRGSNFSTVASTLASATVFSLKAGDALVVKVHAAADPVKEVGTTEQSGLVQDNCPLNHMSENLVHSSQNSCALSAPATQPQSAAVTSAPLKVEVEPVMDSWDNAHIPSLLQSLSRWTGNAPNTHVSNARRVLASFGGLEHKHTEQMPETLEDFLSASFTDEILREDQAFVLENYEDLRTAFVKAVAEHVHDFCTAALYINPVNFYAFLRDGQVDPAKLVASGREVKAELLADFAKKHITSLTDSNNQYSSSQVAGQLEDWLGENGGSMTNTEPSEFSDILRELGLAASA